MHQKWLILASVACGTFMATLDSSIVNVALPSITAEFHTGIAHSRWVVIAYLFSITGLLLLFGKLADVLGRKLVFNLGYVIFTIGCLCCGMSRDISQLILSRGLQGFGAAMLMANGPAIIATAFPPNERGKALGTLAMVVSAGLAMGPSIGGFLVKFVGWPSIFFINIPFGILGTILVQKYMPTCIGLNAKTDPLIFERERALPLSVRLQVYASKLRYFDWLGAFMWMFIQFGYSLAIDRENVLGLAGPLQRLVSFGSIGLLLLFLVWELSVHEPVLDLSLFRSRAFLVLNLSGLFQFVAISGITLLLPFYFQNVRGLHPHEVGLIMTAVPMTIFFVAPISGRLSDKYGSRALSTFGLALICASIAALAIPGTGLSSSNPNAILINLVFIGCGVGLFQSPNNNAIMGAVKPESLGVASALLATVRNLGLVTGVALSTSLLMHFYGEHSTLRGVLESPKQNFTDAMRDAVLTLAVISSIGVLLSWARGRSRPLEKKNEVQLPHET